MTSHRRFPRLAVLTTTTLVMASAWWLTRRDADQNIATVPPTPAPPAFDAALIAPEGTPRPPAASDSELAHRTVLAGTLSQTLRTADPEEIETRLVLSEAARARLASDGITDVDGHLRRRLHEIRPPEAELRAYYDSHRVLFGQRTYP